MGVIVPNPKVATVDGATSVANVKEIKVTNGDLTDDGGRVVTVDTSGSGAAPAGNDGDYQLKDGDGFGTGVINGETNGEHTLTLDPDTSAAATIRTYNATAGGTSKQFVLSTSEDGGTAAYNSLVIYQEGGGGIHMATDTRPVTLESGKLRPGSDGTEMRVEAYDGAPAISMTNATNADVELQPKGTGTAMVRSDGANDPKLVMTSTSKAITLAVGTNKKLDVDGGVHKFTLDASSASGGITFPDGTTQTTAASGGGVSQVGSPFFDAEAAGAPSGERQNLFSLATIGTSDFGTGAAMKWSNSSFYDTPFAWPFIAPFTGDIDTLRISIQGAFSGGSEPPLKMGIYTADADHFPDSLQGEASFDTDTADYVSATLDSTVSLTAGTLYFLVAASYAQGASSGTLNLQGQGSVTHVYNQPTDSAYPPSCLRGEAFTSDSDSLPATFSWYSSGWKAVYRPSPRVMVREGA